MTRRHCVTTVLGLAAALSQPGVVHALPTTNQVVALTSPWRYTASNVDGAAWTAPGYNDSSWSGPGNGLFYIESATLPAAKNTPLPAQANGDPLPCYYFRTSFFSGNLNNLVGLHFKHLTDDGAIFYLNGAEIQRVRMLAGPVSYATEAHDAPPDGDATAFDSFSLVGRALTNLVDGVNVLAVRVHQNGTESSDVVFGAQVSVIRDAAPVVRLVRGPYLQVCTPSSIVIRWRTDLEENSRVAYTTDPTGTADSVVSDSEAVTEHEVTVTGLAPDTRYFYTIGSSSRVLAGGDATFSFRTHPLPGQPKPLRLWVTGDAGTADSHAEDVRNAFEAMNGSRAVDAWLQLGDNAYDDGTDAQYQAAMFDMYAQRLRQTPVWVTLANHETYSTDWNGEYAYFNTFTVPALAEAGGVASHTQSYYSFDIGMVHFVSLDSMLSDRSAEGDMATWLRADLAATTSRWLIAFFHHPPYTKGSHDSDTESELIEMRENILPILEAGGVDLVLSGHSHSYERSGLLDGHYGMSTALTAAMILSSGSRDASGDGAYVKPENASGCPIANRGAVYVVAGSSGKTSGGDLNHPAMRVSTNKLGSVVLDITPDRLSAVFLRDTGATNDVFSIVKTNYAPVASNLAIRVNADQSTSLVLSASDLNRNALSFAMTSPPAHGLVSGFDAASGAFTYTPAHGSTNTDSLTFLASDGRLGSIPGTVTITVNPLSDADRDGLPDDWEARYGIADPAGDADRDGASNLHEYRAGTDPKNPGSWLRLIPTARGQSGFVFAWASVGGTRYRVLYSDGSEQGGFNGAFTALPRSVQEEMDPRPAGTPGVMSFLDDFTVTGAPPPHGSRFYRIVVVQ